jgi:hypothetical protein
MIEGLHSLGRNPLPAITTLNLRSNRLVSLAGIERLLSLERVDLRDNKLTDPTEIARLTVVPDITDVYVYRNPFCKSYSNYRVTIFNLFRKTPGYTEDIVIDSTGPSNSEKKQLVERVPELPGVPVIKPPPEDDVPPPKKPPMVIATVDGPSDSSSLPKRTSSHHRSKSGHTGSRRKKVPKRRVVELSQNELAQQALQHTLAPHANPFDLISPSAEAPSTSDPAADVGAEVMPRFEEPQMNDMPGDPTKKRTTQEQEPTETVQMDHQQLPPINTAVNNTAVKPIEQTTSPPEFDVSSDLYKKKIEALRQDFGNTWLSALGDDSWDATSVTSFPERGYSSPPIRPALPRTPSQSIVSGGRTLG